MASRGRFFPWRAVTASAPGFLLLASIVAWPLVNGCGGGGGGPSGLIGRVASRVEWTVPPDTYALLTADRIASLIASGATVADGKITMPTRGAAGRWVHLGTLWLMTDASGYFHLGAVPAGVAQGQVFHNRADSTPEATFSVSSIVPASQTPTPVVITYAFGTIGDMNPPGRGVSRSSTTPCCSDKGPGRGGNAPDGCPLRDPCLPITDPNANASGCCLDYDGSAGDGLPRDRTSLVQLCFARAHLNFILSTCYDWSFNVGANGGNDCDNEAAFTAGTGPSCWVNHRYRNCQSLDKSDFHVLVDKPTILVGEKATITLQNNTPANETVVGFQEGNDALGKLTVTGPNGASGFADENNNLVVLHYDNNAKTHFREVTLEYTAPDKLPNNAKQATFHVQAQAYGITLYEPIVVKDAKGNLNVGVH